MLSGTASGPESAKGWKHRAWGLVAMVLLGLCFFLPTSFFVLPGFGLDTSWQLTLNKAFSDGWAFGDRLIWTYGPLGFLEARFPYGISPYFYAAFDLLVFLLFLRLAWDAATLKMDFPLVLGFVACLFAVKVLIHDHPSSTLYCLLIFLCVRNLRQPSALSSLGLVLVSAIILLFKMNYGLVGLCLCIAIALAKFLMRDKSAWGWLVLAVLQLFLAFVFAAFLHTNLAAYIRSSLDLVSAYSDGMAWGPRPEWGPPGLGVAHLMVCVFFWGFLALALFQAGKRRLPKDDWLYLLIAAGATFVLFKSAVVRSDFTHNKIFLLGFPILALVFLIHGTATLQPLWRWLFLGSVAYASLIMVAEFGNSLIYLRADYLEAFFPVNYFKGMKDYRLAGEWKNYTQSVSNGFPERLVPPLDAKFIGTNTVDVFPFESTLALGSGLSYQPRPIPQTYGVMGPALEARNEAYLTSDRAPRFVLYVLGEKAYSIDGRYQLWEEPAVKRLLRQFYVPRQVFTNVQGAPPTTQPGPCPVLVLERKPATNSEPVVVATQTEFAGKAFRMPQAQGELYARIRLRKTLLGKLVSFFYRGAPAYARFRLEGGDEKLLRVLPANLENGVLVNYFMDGAQPQSVWNYLCRQSQGNPRCLQLQLEFDHPWEYHKQFEVTYFREAQSAH